MKNTSHHSSLWPILCTILTLFIFVFAGCGNSTSSSSANQAGNAKTSVKSAVSSSAPIDGNLHVYMLNVGQADSILIQYNGQNMLIDTGDVDHRASLVKQLKDKNVSEIENVIITHPHGDHLGGMTALFKNFKIKHIYDNGVTANNAMYRNYLSTIKSNGIPHDTLRKGDQVTFNKDIIFTILAPSEPLFSADNTRKVSTNGITNNNSIVSRMTYGDFSILFSGDAQKESEKKMLNEYGNQLKSDILKVGHHGSKTSSYIQFVKAVAPKAALISCGAGNEYKFPHKPTLDTLNKLSVAIYRTDIDGTITITSNGESYSISKEH